MWEDLDDGGNIRPVLPDADMTGYDIIRKTREFPTILNCTFDGRPLWDAWLFLLACPDILRFCGLGKMAYRYHIKFHLNAGRKYREKSLKTEALWFFLLKKAQKMYLYM